MTGLPSPASGHSALSGLEIATPITTAADRASAMPISPAVGAPLRRAVAPLRRRRLLRLRPRSAGLSSRSPLNEACRTLPSAVQPANSISATSSGFTQWTSRRLARRVLAAERTCPWRHRAFRRGIDALDRVLRRSRCRPGRHRPDGRRDRRRPAASGTCRWSSFQPPITTSWPARHLALVQLSPRPER